MKKNLLIILLILSATTAFSQKHERKHGEEKHHREITEIVGDLTNNQKRKIDAITKESKERVEAMRNEKKKVCDSIVMFIEKDGDQTKVLYTLFEREARLQVNINREMYSTKLKVDEILTPEQRKELRQACAKKRKAHR